MKLRDKVFENLARTAKLPVGYVRYNGRNKDENLYLSKLNKNLLPVLGMFLEIVERISQILAIPMAVTNWIRWSPSHRTGLAIDVAFRPSIPDYGPYHNEDPLLNLRREPFESLQSKVVNDPVLMEILRKNHTLLAHHFRHFRGSSPIMYIFIETHHLHIMILPEYYDSGFMTPKDKKTPTKPDRTGTIRVFRFFMPSFTKGWKNGAFDYNHGRAHFLENGPLQPDSFKHIRRKDG